MEKVRRKILMLADAQSNHTYKWATALSDQGFDICIFSLNQSPAKLYEKEKKIKVINNPVSSNIFQKTSSNFLKLQYLTAIIKLKKTIKQFQPDILHAHYASSYGLLGALSGFHPYIISIWGADIYDFPVMSVLHKKIIKYNLKKADKLLSTSKVMAKETEKYTGKNIEITPFGVNLDIFKLLEKKSIFEKENIVIGTIKSLEKKYGIEYLIEAFSIVKRNNPNISLKLLIVGDGSQKKSLIELSKRLSVFSDTVFSGKVDHSEVPNYLNMMDIYVALSILNSESFGVAVVEAQSCQKPVVVANVGGLPEVVENGISGYVVPPKNAIEAAIYIEKLIKDDKLRKKLGELGRKRVTALYNWNNNVNQMIDIYEKILSFSKRKY